MAVNPVQRADPWRRRLYLPAYSVADSARYARTTPQAVARWHFGASSLGPVIRGKKPGMPGREHRRPLSYIQLVEIAFVATLRGLGVSLQSIHRTREYAATVLKAEYPFAELRWKTEGVRLLLELIDIDDSGIAKAGEVVFADAFGQIGWSQLISNRFLEFEYVDDIALRWHLRGAERPVVIDPRIAFGAPTIGGLPTWVVKGRFQAGEELPDIAEDFGLDELSVREALGFEGIEIPTAA